MSKRLGPSPNGVGEHHDFGMGDIHAIELQLFRTSGVGQEQSNIEFNSAGRLGYKCKVPFSVEEVRTVHCLDVYRMCNIRNLNST